MSVELLTHAAEQLDVDRKTFDRMTTVQDVAVVEVGDGAVFQRVFDVIPDETGDTQGGFRIETIPDDKVDGTFASDLEADRLEATALAAGMTPKLGFVLTCLRIAIERGMIPEAFSVPMAGGVKAKLSMLESVYNDKEALGHVLDNVVDGHRARLLAGDGIGPDMNVSQAMMLHMAEYAETKNSKLRHHFTCKPNGLPGRFEATGRFGVQSFYRLRNLLGTEIPDENKTVIVQGQGAAGDPATEHVHKVLGPDGYRLKGIGDANVAVIANNPDEGLKPNRDYAVDGRGHIIFWNKDTTSVHDKDELLHHQAGVKILAATGNVVTKDNVDSVLKDTEAIIEIANGGINAAVAKEIEVTHPKLIVSPVPFASAGGVVTSLLERHRPSIEKELGRKITPEDVMHILTQLAIVGAEIQVQECESRSIGAFTADYGLGLREQYDIDPIAA
jgi:hypothetical protein